LSEATRTLTGNNMQTALNALAEATLERRPGRFAAGAALAACLCLSVAAFAQQSGGEQPSDEPSEETDAPARADEDRRIDEIVVTAQKPGDRERAEAPYEQLMRERLVREMDAMRERQDEFEWRQGDGPAEPSRIRLGYRAQDDSRDRRDTALTDLPIENTKPATLFRFEF